MFDKRLVSLVPGCLKLVLASVAGKWVALVATIGIFWVLSGFVAHLRATPCRTQVRGT